MPIIISHSTPDNLIAPFGLSTGSLYWYNKLMWIRWSNLTGIGSYINKIAALKKIDMCTTERANGGIKVDMDCFGHLSNCRTIYWIGADNIGMCPCHWYSHHGHGKDICQNA